MLAFKLSIFSWRLFFDSNALLFKLLFYTFYDRYLFCLFVISRQTDGQVFISYSLVDCILDLFNGEWIIDAFFLLLSLTRSSRDIIVKYWFTFFKCFIFFLSKFLYYYFKLVIFCIYRKLNILGGENFVV